MNVNKKPKQIPIVLAIIFIFTSCFSGCITDPTNGNHQQNNTLKTMDVPLNQIALNETEVNFTSIEYSNYTTDSYIMENLTGNNLLWNISEYFIIIFMSDLSIGMQEVLFKFPSNDEALNYMNLVKPYLINQTHSTEKVLPLIGDESFMLSREITIENKSINHWAIYFRLRNVIAIISGPSEKSSSFIPYAESIEEKILNTFQ